MSPYSPYGEDEIRGTVANWRRAASVPYIEEEPADRESQPCWCTDFHRDVGLHLTYCPRHGREPDRELWDYSAGDFPD
jgi:hypothetical protein